MAVAAAADRLADGRWIRSATFDHALIFTPVIFALGAGAIVWRRPNLLPLLLALDALLLGRQHVVAAYSRLAGDPDPVRRRLLLAWVPLLVLTGVCALYVTAGARVLHTIYYHWQWFHYHRQGYGVERIYARAEGGPARAPDRLTRLVVYGVPVWGLLARSSVAARESGTFLGSPLFWAPVPTAVVRLAGLVALGALALWIWRDVVRRALEGRSVSRGAVYVLSHALIFTVAYVGFRSVDGGWLVVNVWHNAQYIIVVWLFNANRFRAGVDPRRRVVSALYQPRALAAYVLAFLGLATVVYLAIDGAAGWLARYGIPGAVILYSAVNFHHYIVDALVWKVRKQKLRTALGLA